MTSQDLYSTARDNDQTLSSQNPSGFSAGGNYPPGSNIESERAGYDSPLGKGTQQQQYGQGATTGDLSGIGGDTTASYGQQKYGQGATTGQHDSSGIGGDPTASYAQQQFGQGVGHHKGHHEGHLHGHGSDEAARANCTSCARVQTAGTGTGLGDQYSSNTTGKYGDNTGTNPSTVDKIIGGTEKFVGKVTSNTGLYQRGEDRTNGN